jgi:hypothetical protein
LVVLSFVALVTGPGALIALPLLVVGLTVGLRLVPGFWSVILGGVAGGSLPDWWFWGPVYVWP